MIDVVIPLALGSAWQDNELRYCLRSLEKNIAGIGQVFLVGYKPSFLNGSIIHLPTQPLCSNKAKNIAQNVKTACLDSRLSEDFLFINDDYFFTKPIDAATYPFYWKGDLQKSINANANNDYSKHVSATIQVLKRYGLPTKNFDTHYPIRLRKSAMLQVLDFYDFPPGYGFVLKSLYCNTARANGTFRLDCKERHAKPYAYWQALAGQKEVFSIADACLGNGLKNFLQDAFPEKSHWEK